MMTSFKQEQATEPSSGSQCFDPFDSFINYDQTVVPTPSISPLSSRSKSISTPTSSSSSQQSNLLSPQPSQPTFAGPSHQYGQYRQQAGLPVGALANTFAVNQVDQFGFGRDQLSYDVIPPTDGSFGTNTTDDFLDFGSTPTQTSNSDMDLDFGSPTDMNVSKTSFINPAAIGGQESTSQPQATQSHPARVYPGMHQQAALAKAQAEAARQQQSQHQHDATQQQQRSVASGHSRQSSRGGNSTRPPTDPIVEESISRLLNQMRQSSVASSNDDATTPNANGGSSHTRVRKDEEDMDEDERLLASEEGKKLSSKERRQLRNKVSARAFRSRRKGNCSLAYRIGLLADFQPEYIGQLEGEIAAKQGEADELRVRNEELMAENTRLTDLTRMLLSSPAFSTFLNELSRTGASASMPELPQPLNQTPLSHPQPTTSRKDVNPSHATSQQTQSQQQNNMHVGLTMIPEESSFDYTATGSLNTGYADNMDFGGLYDAQVYAVTSLPIGPAVDSIEFSMLHGKSSNFVRSYSEADDAKTEPAVIERMPTMEKREMPAPIETPSEEDDIDIDDPSFALYRDQPSSNIPSTSVEPATPAPEDRIFGEIELDKAFGRVELVFAEEPNELAEVSSATMARFERLCSKLEGCSAMVAAVTGQS